MKRIWIACLFLAMAWAGTVEAKIKVVATLSDLASIAEEVGGDRVDVDAIADGRVDLHNVQILPSYMLLVKRADLFVKVGMDLEIWSWRVLDGAHNPNLRVIDCSQNIQVMQRPTTPVNPSMGDIHIMGNPHYWLDPANGAVIAEAILNGLIEVDAEGADYYLERYDDFRQRLEDRIAGWEKEMEPYHGSEVVYFHNSWPYFSNRFGLVEAGFVEPKPGISPSPGHTAEIIKLIRTRDIRVVAISSYFDSKVPESIARQTGAEVVVLASSVGGVEGANNYFTLFDVNLRKLRAALEPEP